MENPSFSSNVQPNIIYTPFPKIESYLGAKGFAICFQISFLHELYFLLTLDKIITWSIRFLATTRLHIFSLCGLFAVQVNFLSQVHRNTCRTQSAADRNLNAVGLMWGGGSGSAPSLFPPPSLYTVIPPCAWISPLRAHYPHICLLVLAFLVRFWFHCRCKLHQTNFGPLQVAGESPFFLSTFCFSVDNFSFVIVATARCFPYLSHLDFFHSPLRAIFTQIATDRSCQCNSAPM